MLVAMLSWLLAIPLLGVTTGLRAMTPMAVLCWFAYLGYLPVQNTWAEWTASVAAVAAFTALALAEIVADKLPRIPDRFSEAPLMARLFFGGLIGSIAATAFAGFMVRRELVERIGCAEWMVALVEDLIAVACAGFAMHVVTN